MLSSLCVLFQRSDDTQMAQGCVDPSHVLPHDGQFSVHSLWSGLIILKHHVNYCDHNSSDKLCYVLI